MVDAGLKTTSKECRRARIQRTSTAAVTEERHCDGTWQDPEALLAAGAAGELIAAGAVAEGAARGIGCRRNRVRRARSSCSVEAPPEVEPPSSPELRLLLFTDQPSPASFHDLGESAESNRAESRSWESMQPRSYIDWAYRNTPWHGNNSEAPGSSIPSRESPKTSAIGRRCYTRLLQTPHSDWLGSATAATAHFKTLRATSATPTSMAGSTRAPSRATQASPNELGNSRAPSRATQASPEEHGRLALSPAPQPDGAASFNSRTPSPDARRPLEPKAHGAVLGCATVPRAEQLRVAAEAAGERARGTVTIAIRARAVCRNVANSATRRLLHLSSGSEKPGLPAASVYAADSDSSGESDSATTLVSERCPSEMTNLWPLTGIDQWATVKKQRVIKVARNTPLGRMILEDPERATKYDLVAVPAWTQNKPWPPPAVKCTRKAVRDARQEEADKALAQQVNRKSAVHKTEKRLAVHKVRAVGMMLALRKVKKDRRASTKEVECQQSSDKGLLTIPDSDLSTMEDLETAVSFMDDMERKHYKHIFNRFAVPDRSLLSRSGIIHALRETGHTPSTFEEQRSFAVVQEQIFKHCRPTGGESLMNPLTSPQGMWEMHEFMLMVVAMCALSGRQIRLQNKECAEEYNITIKEVESLRDVFSRFDDDGSGSISKLELKALLLAVEARLNEEQFTLLVESVGLGSVDEMDFHQFLRIGIQIDEIVGAAAARQDRNLTKKRTFRVSDPHDVIGAVASMRPGQPAETIPEE